MNTETDPIKLELMKHVERAVRSVVALPKQKMGMRRELLSHLTELYEQEMAGGCDAQAAAARAIERLGEAGELTRQLQSTVSRSDRWVGRAVQSIEWRQGEPVMRHAARVSLCVGALASVPVLVTMALSDHSLDRGFSLVTFGLVYTLLFMASAFCLVAAGHRLSRAIRRGAWLAAAGWSASAGPVCMAVIAVVFAVIAGPHHVPREVPHAWPILILAPLMFLGVTLAWVHDRKKSAEWTGLVLE